MPPFKGAVLKKELVKGEAHGALICAALEPIIAKTTKNVTLLKAIEDATEDMRSPIQEDDGRELIEPLAHGTMTIQTGAHLLIPVTDLLSRDATEFDVVGLHGNRFLRVHASADTRKLHVYAFHQTEEALCTIGNPNHTSALDQKSPLQIWGPDHRLYGMIEQRNTKQFAVVQTDANNIDLLRDPLLTDVSAQGQTLMLIDRHFTTLEPTSATAKPRITTIYGKELATTFVDDKFGQRHVQLHVLPGVDIVLVVSCAIASMMLF